jgi:hypothetical protein
LVDIDILVVTVETTIITDMEKKIDSITKSCKPFINKILKDLSIKHFENANVICDYIIVEQTEFNIKDSTKNGKIKALVYLSNHLQDTKSFKEMTKQDILDFGLDCCCVAKYDFL